MWIPFIRILLRGLPDGRKKSIRYIDSIGQGRIWSGEKALELGLVDRIGGVQDALDCAARMAKLKTYRLREYPEPENFLDLLLNNYKQSVKLKTIREDLGEQGARWYQMMSDYQIHVWCATNQTSFEFSLIP